jgi:hypothetical protein
MKKMLLVLSPLCLGLVSGIALVIACNSSSTSSAQTTPSSALSVVDSAGNVLGTLLGSGPGFSSSYNNAGTAVAVERYVFAQMHTFLDASGHIWNVGGDGTFWQPVDPVYFTDSACTSAGYIPNGDPKVVSRHAGGFWIRTGTASVLTPGSYYPPGSPTGTCLPYPPPAISPITTTATTVLAMPVSSLQEVTPPTVVPPVTIN